MKDDATNADDNPKPRRWLTYSLRSLVALMLVSCVGFAWFGFHWRAYRRWHAAVQPWEAIGGTVNYDWRQEEIVTLVFSRTRVTDAVLVHLRELKQLKNLHLTHTQVTDVGLVCLCELKQLQVLNFSATEVSDAGVVRHYGATKTRENHLVAQSPSSARLG
ncbi:MAG: hypothetical protein N2C14_24725 [Planctomycetales bacterium]